MEVTELVRRGSACLHFLAVLSGNPGHSLMGLLRMHVLLVDWLRGECLLAWLNSEMTEKPLRGQDEGGVQGFINHFQVEAAKLSPVRMLWEAVDSR